MLRIKEQTILQVAILLAAAVSAHAGIFYVDPTFQGETPTGESWLSAFPSLQDAIDAAARDGGGEVWVKGGVHHPSAPSRNATFEIKPGVSLYGGFRGNETERSQRNIKSNRTIINGDVGRMGSSADNSYHVITGSANIRIDGFIISRGNANSAGDNRLGGGLVLPAGSDNVTVANCTFEKNNAEIGGAIHAAGSTLTLTNCTFYSNSAETGGAIALGQGARLNASDCAFSSSFAPANGGAVSMGTDTEAKFIRCSYQFNSTDGRGGALFAETDQENGIKVEIVESRFTQNTAKENGGALAFKGPFVPIVADCTFAQNRSTQGAGAIGNESGISAVVTGATFTKNHGVQGSEDTGSDESSRVVDSAEEAAKLAEAGKVAAQQAQEAEQAAEPEVVEKPKRKLADVYVHNEQGIKVKLRSIVAGADYTAIALGDLTDPRFISHYRKIEAAARDYVPPKVRFYYLYRHLAHPENHGYIKPFQQAERARQATLAKKWLHTKVPWLVDDMDNEAAGFLAQDPASNVFLFVADGTELYAGPIENAKALRAALAEAAGRVDDPTQAGALPNTSLAPFKALEEKFYPRVDVSLAARFQPLETTPLDSRYPHYAKLRVEGNQELLESGNGKLYLGFHIDPLYQVAWNNLGDPMKYAVKVPAGVVAPSINSAERVTAEATDAEPREFVIEARKLDLSKPFAVQVNYSVHSLASGKNIEVSQQYMVYLQPDRFGGQVVGRQLVSPKRNKATPKRGTGNAFAMMLRRYDIDRNGKLSPDESIGNLRTRFNEVDTDKDGFVTEEEYLAYRNKQ